ncbi:MAG: TRAP transporter large permease [Spirochaetaceae bacterium]|jgi:C4-dicarboxylate transporter DctM subunit|nr:TRAP transporter large permease [Spirochaetaceae bacterium]
MAVLLFVIFFGLMALGVPIAASMGLGILSNSIFGETVSLAFIGRGMVSALDSFPVLAVPIFIFAGEIMAKGGISKRLFNFANACLGGLTGGVPMATVFTCMLFGAISGSGSATFAAVGTIMIPIMTKQGYDRRFITALTAASGGLGVLIPPSLPMVMYGVSSGASIGDMFMAGIIPGVGCGLALMIYAYIFSKTHPITIDESQEPRMGVFKSLLDGFWALLCPVIILGGIYGGVFTATEAAGVAALYGVIVSKFIYKTLEFKEIPGILLRAARLNAPILLIVAIATVFGRILTIQNIPTALAEGILSLTDNTILILIFMNVILLIAGMFMEALAAIVILTPILLPIAVNIGLNPIHFGTMMVANLAIGFVTPPVGTNLYAASGITGIPIKDIIRAAWGPIIALLIVQLFVIIIPGLSTWLPSMAK